MKLKDVLKNINYKLLKGNLNIEINGIEDDSRQIKENYLFISIFGFNENGHKYINEAICNGANSVIICNDITEIDKFDGCVIKVDDTRVIENIIAMNFYNNPQDKLIKIGITGTKGKTTTSYMIKNILEESGFSCGIIGTNGIYIKDKYIACINTTPKALDVIKYMSEMVKYKIKYLVMEVSSQALKYDRVSNIIFDYGIFTNLTKDHIGKFEHDNMNDYVISKSKLFKQCKCGIFNIDDKYFYDIIRDANCSIITYGYSKNADLRVVNLELLRDDNFVGIWMDIDGVVRDSVKVSTIGRFSSYNAMAAILTCKMIGIDIKYIKKVFSDFSVKGRVEPIYVSRDFTLLIDYAHNGISTKSVLSAIREYNPKRIVTIFGCGGNRSRDRRYEMGEMAGKYSDFCIITEDNNRYEEFDNIAKDILVGISKTGCKYKIISDRKEAIKYAIVNGKKGDIIMLLGKGHEDYKEIKGVRYPFDEREVIKEILDEIRNN